MTRPTHPTPTHVRRRGLRACVGSLCRGRGRGKHGLRAAALLAFAALPPAVAADIVVTDVANPSVGRIAAQRWYVATDRVMGGRSDAALRRARIDGRAALVLAGPVRADNDGGFILGGVALADALTPQELALSRGLRLHYRGARPRCLVNLRTRDTRLPWQAYLAALPESAGWRSLELPWHVFRGDAGLPALRADRLLRVQLVCVGAGARNQLAWSRLELLGPPV